LRCLSVKGWHVLMRSGKFRLQSRLSTVGVSNTVEWGLLNSENSSVFKKSRIAH